MSRSSMNLILVPQSTNMSHEVHFLMYYFIRTVNIQVTISMKFLIVDLLHLCRWQWTLRIILDLNENFSAHLFQLGFERCLRQILAWSSVTGNNFRERRWRWLMLFYNIGSSILLQMQPIKKLKFSHPVWEQATLKFQCKCFSEKASKGMQ